MNDSALSVSVRDKTPERSHVLLGIQEVLLHHHHLNLTLYLLTLYPGFTVANPHLPRFGFSQSKLRQPVDSASIESLESISAHLIISFLSASV